MTVRLDWDNRKRLEAELANLILTDSTTYTALTEKNRAIIYGTGSAPTPTGYPDGCLYVQYTP
jgi:hypothetical protein